MSLITLIVSGSFGLMLVKLFQTFEFLKLINIPLPSNFAHFLSFFESNIFDFIPNFISVSETGICNTHQKIQENEMDCLVVNGAGGILG